MENGENTPLETQTSGREKSGSTNEILTNLERRIGQCEHANEKRILEATLSISEKRVTYLLALLALLGILYPLWKTERNTEKVDEAIKGMEARFKALSGEYLRKPEIVCEVDGAPLSGKTLVGSYKAELSQSFTIRNSGDAPAGLTYVYLYLKQVPDGLGFVAVETKESAVRGLTLDQLPSNDPRFAAQYLVTRIAAFHAKREFTLCLWWSPLRGKSLDLEIPAMIKVYYDGPQPMEIPFTVKITPEKQP